MKDHRLRIGFMALLLGAILASVAFAPVHGRAQAAAVAAPVAAADLDMKGQTFYVLDVTTSAVKTVILPGQSCVIAHLGVQDDGTTASSATDTIVVMFQSDTMAANYNAGRKVVIKANGAARFPAGNIPSGTDGAREIQIKAVGNGAKVQIIVGG